MQNRPIDLETREMQNDILEPFQQWTLDNICKKIPNAVGCKFFWLLMT